MTFFVLDDLYKPKQSHGKGTPEFHESFSGYDYPRIEVNNIQCINRNNRIRKNLAQEILYIVQERFLLLRKHTLTASLVAFTIMTQFFKEYPNSQ